MSKIITIENFLNRAKKTHGDKYDYSKVNYVNMRTKVCIVCPKHGEFWQTPQDHVHNRGCPMCGLEKTKNSKIKSVDSFIEQARKVHGNKYDYSKVEYLDRKTKVRIICPEHGEFWQTPQGHLSGRGCQKCANTNRNKTKIIDFKTFVKRSNKIHSSKYEYIEKDIKNEKEKVEMICPIHGVFNQEIDSHLHGHGCPKCGVSVSKQEQELIDFLKENKIDILERQRNLLKKSHKEIDIFLPEYNVGIEYNGLRWHSDEFNDDANYHLNKTNDCEKNNIRLIQIFEDEWILKKEIVKSKILHIIGLENKDKIMARKCVVKEINKNDAKKFLEKNHIQGYSRSTINIGAYFRDNLIGVASFIKIGNDYILNRLATDINYICQGVCSKLIAFFDEKYEYKTLITFADRRWICENNVYSLLGFKKDKIIKPTYTYRHGNKIERIHKFNLRKQFLCKKYNFPSSMTENEITKKMKYYKIYDCGLIKYVKNKRDS